MNETAKAHRRRFVEQATGLFDWSKVIRGTLLDVGAGADPHPLATALFDKEGSIPPLETTAQFITGDANHLSTYYPPESFDTLHASQCLEHMLDPWAATEDWLKVVKHGGHMVITIPDWCLYEGMQWPSRFNGDHKSTWSMWLKGSPAPYHIYLPDYAKRIKALGTRFWRIELCDANYDYHVGTSRDQTWVETDGVEAFIEVVIQRL